MAEIIVETLFCNPWAKVGSTGSLTTAQPKKIKVYPVGITFNQHNRIKGVQVHGNGAWACFAHALQGSF